MEENEIFQEQQTSEATEDAAGKPPENITEIQPDPIIEEVQSRHERKRNKKESFGDVLVMQITLCIILLLMFAAVNIIRPDFVKAAVLYFRDMTRGEPEDFFKKAAHEAMKIING